MGTSYILVPYLGFRLYTTSLRQDMNFQFRSYINVIKGMYGLSTRTFFFFSRNFFSYFFLIHVESFKKHFK